MLIQYDCESKNNGVHSWNHTICQTPSTRNYHLTGVCEITRQTVVSGNMHLTAISRIRWLTAIFASILLGHDKHTD